MRSGTGASKGAFPPRRLNVFVAFFRRNLKPAVQKAVSMLHVARLMLAELYLPLARGPT
ncbi:MAG: hypothetical protein V2A79_06115 [Planctomycetota bacterium]